MALTKKDFIALADMVRAHNAKHPKIGYNAPSASGGVWGAPFNRSHIEALADFCEANAGAGGFDRVRWLAYGAGMCGANGKPLNKEGQ